MPAPPGALVCTRCHAFALPRRVVPGLFAVELLLYVLFIIPGIAYTLWRVTNKRNVCRACGSDELVPPLSPVGRQILDSR